jgi:hypothetical protein
MGRQWLVDAADQAFVIENCLQAAGQRRGLLVRLISDFQILCLELENTIVILLEVGPIGIRQCLHYNTKTTAMMA